VDVAIESLSFDIRATFISLLNPFSKFQ